MRHVHSSFEVRMSWNESGRVELNGVDTQYAYTQINFPKEYTILFGFQFFFDIKVHQFRVMREKKRKTSDNATEWKRKDVNVDDDNDEDNNNGKEVELFSFV